MFICGGVEEGNDWWRSEEGKEVGGGRGKEEKTSGEPGKNVVDEWID